MNLRKIIEDFIEAEGDFISGNVSGWFELSWTVLAGKEFDDIGETKVGGAAMPELEPIAWFGGSGGNSLADCGKHYTTGNTIILSFLYRKYNT